MPLARETHLMRTVLLAEMIWNFQGIAGLEACLMPMQGGQVESTYAVLEIGRMIFTRNVAFRFVEPVGKLGSDYDLEIFYPDGVKACGETKCKLEDTEITLETVEESLRKAREQLPAFEPGIVL